MDVVPLIGFIDSVCVYKGRQLNQIHHKLTMYNLEFVSFTYPAAQSTCIRWARWGVVRILTMLMDFYEWGAM